MLNWKTLIAYSLFAGLVGCLESDETEKDEETETSEETSDNTSTETDTEYDYYEYYEYYEDCGMGAGSCDFGSTVCIEGEVVDEAWCTGNGGSFYSELCPTPVIAGCDIPAGANSDYPYCAYVYYYDGFADPAAACADAGGTLH